MNGEKFKLDEEYGQQFIFVVFIIIEYTTVGGR